MKIDFRFDLNNWSLDIVRTDRYTSITVGPLTVYLIYKDDRNKEETHKKERRKG